jgi:hypothetical protein
MKRLLAFALALLAAAPAAAQLLPPLPGGSLIVSMSSPANGATVSGTVTVGASVSIVGTLTVARVDFYADGGFIGSDASAPYAVAWDSRALANGTHTLKAVAQDVLGARWNANPITITVANGPPPDTTPPTVSITSPKNGATVSGTINITASATDNVGVVGVEFVLDGVVRADDTAAPYSVPWDTKSVGDGTHTLRAVARDAAGNRTTSTAVTVTVANAPPADTIPPTVSITAPANGATVSGSITVSASASDNVSVTGVQFRLDGTNLGAQDTGAPYAVSWNTTLAANGAHTLTAVARDAAGNTTTSAPVTVTVANGPPPDTTPPSVSITAPANGATVSGTVNVTASASDDIGVASVQFRLDGVDAGAPDTGAPYAIAWNTATASDGTHTISAVARDAAGNTTTSAPVTVTVANGSPAAARFEEDHAAVSAAPAGAWSKIGAEVAAFSGGTAGASNAAGASVTFTFSGSGVSWIGLKCNACGIAGVSVDGGAPVTVDTAGPGAPDGSLAAEVLFSAAGLDPAASHTLALTVTGNTSSGAAYVVVDAFDVTGGSGSAALRIEETGPGVSVTGSWSLRGAETATFSGGQAGSSNVSGTTLTLDFNGTAVSWIGLRCSACGIATVALDGGAPQPVDTAGPAAPGSPGLASEPVFSASGLAAGGHRLVITVTGNTNSAGAHVIIDAFDVTP